MGVLQRFERRLEGLVEGAFAKAFRSSVQPVEVAGALQRGMVDRAVIVSAERTLAPNDFVVELGPGDHERLAPYEETLTEELATMLREHAAEEHLTVVGPIQVRFVEEDDLDTGMFRIRSDVVRGTVDPGATPAATDLAEKSGVPRLVCAPGTPAEATYVLNQPRLVIGRGEASDLQLADPGASRRHAEVRSDGSRVTLVDLGSTNGTLVNGQRVDETNLSDGDTIVIGETTLTFHGHDRTS
jgi:FHA domain-containing protein